MAWDTLLTALFIAALFVACLVLAFWPSLAALFQGTNREINEWAEQDAPRPQEGTRA
jgi:hypothetical protein